MTDFGSFEHKAPAPRSRPDPAHSASILPLAPKKSEPPPVTFDRHELQAILNVYGRKVAEGEWRDYAIHFDSRQAIFSIYRRASEMPLYRVIKDPKLATKQGAYSIVAVTGLVLRRGHDLGRVLQVFDKKLKVVRA